MTHQKSTTPDERLLMKIYETALARGNPLGEVHLIKVASLVGIKEKAARTIAKELAQANFLKKGDGDRVSLTERGCTLAKECL